MTNVPDLLSTKMRNPIPRFTPTIPSKYSKPPPPLNFHNVQTRKNLNAKLFLPPNVFLQMALPRWSPRMKDSTLEGQRRKKFITRPNRTFSTPSSEAQLLTTPQLKGRLAATTSRTSAASTKVFKPKLIKEAHLCHLRY